MNINAVADVKLAPALAYVSQWEPSIHRYGADWDPAASEATKKEVRGMVMKKDGHVVEAFRIATDFNQQ